MTQIHGMLPVLLAGSEEQKQKWLPPAVAGDKVTAIAITEPNAGSDVASMQTVAVRDGDDYVINGSKIFITNGGVADWVCVFAKTDPAARHDGISMFLVERGTPGFSCGKPLRKMGIRGSNTAELFFSDMRVPAANRLGAEGIGFGIAMGALGDARISTAAQALGLAQGAYDIAFEYAQNRKQFGKPIYSYQAVQLTLMDMYMSIVSARLMTYQLARMIDQKARSEFSLESAMAKVHCSDMVMKVTTDAVQLLGGYGYIRDYDVERFMRDAKITQIYDGTNQINRFVMAKRLLKRMRA
jgi:alkylation response protein AidB-like acyl-CoA dehydrogenase